MVFLRQMGLKWTEEAQKSTKWAKRTIKCKISVVGLKNTCFFVIKQRCGICLPKNKLQTCGVRPAPLYGKNTIGDGGSTAL